MDIGGWPREGLPSVCTLVNTNICKKQEGYGRGAHIGSFGPSGASSEALLVDGHPSTFHHLPSLPPSLYFS